MTHCAFKDCGRPVHAAGLCRGHYGQKARHEPLRPLRPYKQVRLGTIRVSQQCADALDREGPTRTQAAKAQLETWARKPR